MVEIGLLLLWVDCYGGLLRWVCGGGGGLLIGLCSWVVFVICVRGGGGLCQAITVGGCYWLWRWRGFFLLIIPGFFCC